MVIASKDSDLHDCHDQHLDWTYFSQDSSKRNQNCGCAEVCSYQAESEIKDALRKMQTPNKSVICNKP